MNNVPESLRLLLESISPGAAKPRDSKYILLRRLATALSQTPAHNDLIVNLTAKVATGFGATPARHDSEQVLWRKIATTFSVPTDGHDSIAMILWKILQVV